MPTVPACEYISGLTFYVCFGSYAGFGARANSVAAVLTVGWVSFGVVTHDIEQVVSLAHHLLQEAEEGEDGELVIDLSD